MTNILPRLFKNLLILSIIISIINGLIIKNKILDVKNT